MIDAASYRRGQWAAFNRVLHWINEQEQRDIPKGDLYDAVMDMRPEPTTESPAPLTGCRAFFDSGG